MAHEGRFVVASALALVLVSGASCVQPPEPAAGNVDHGGPAPESARDDGFESVEDLGRAYTAALTAGDFPSIRALFAPQGLFDRVFGCHLDLDAAANDLVDKLEHAAPIAYVRARELNRALFAPQDGVCHLREVVEQVTVGVTWRRGDELAESPVVTLFVRGRYFLIT